MARRRVLLILVLVAATTIAASSLFRTVRSFYRLDFPVTWSHSAVIVGAAPSGSSAEVAELLEGDRILVIDGQPVERLEDPIFVLASGDERLLTVRSLDDEPRELLFRPPAPAVDLIYLARSAVGLFAVVCAGAAGLLTGRRETWTLALLASASLVLGAVPHRTAESHEILQLIHRMAGASLPFLVIRFFAIFPERQRSMAALDMLAVFAVAGAAATVLQPDVNAWWPVAASAVRVFFGLALLVGVILLVRRWQVAARDARVRRQIEWTALGLFVGLVPYGMLELLPRALGIQVESFSWIVVLPMAALPATVLAALAEYRLWDLELITRETVSATLVVVTGGFIFALTNALLLDQARSLGSLRNLVAFATGVLLVVLLQPVRLKVRGFLDEWLYRGRATPRWLLTHSARDLASATDPRELLERLSETLREGLELEQVASYVRNDEGDFTLVSGDPGVSPSTLPAEVISSEFPHSDERELAAAGFAERVPLERVGTVHGLLHLGLRRGIFPLGTEGREVVSTFAAQAAVALESARYLDDLRRQAEEYRILHANTQRIIESSAAAILVCDASGRILSANSVAAGIFELNPQDLVGVELAELVELPEHWRSHLPLHAEHAEVRSRSPAPRRVIMAVSVLELDSGSFNGRVVVLQDVSELRSLQDRMREQERLAALGRLASGLAHEINTPLTGIASFAQMLGEMTPPTDPRARLVGKLVDQSFRVSRIVANLREAVRGGGESRLVLDLGAVACRAASDAARSLGAASRLETVLPEAPVMVWGATGPVELAVSNLVRNAVEASPADHPIRLVVAGDELWGEAVVEDHGPGIPDPLLEKVFEPFFTTKTERGGTGLGLAICRDMIGQLGGDVSIENRIGGGARASLRLQRWKPSAASS